MDLRGKKILLGVTGGIAAYKSCELLRLFQKAGAEVRVAMTPSARQFVAPLTFASLSKCPVYLENGAIEAQPHRHIDYSSWADIFIAAPCSANSLGKFASGIADEPVSLCFMASSCEKWIAPAMNAAMFSSPAVRKNLDVLKSFGVHILESPAGELACGDFGKGRMLSPEKILEEMLAFTPSLKESSEKISEEGFENKKEIDWKNEVKIEKKKNGKRVLLTAGRTEEAIDPVRYISNRSSGKTAKSLAEAFLAEGFEVLVVAGPMEASFPENVEKIFVKSACEMHARVLKELSFFDAVIHCAAVADYRPAEVSSEKIKDSRSQMVLHLVENPNILADSVRARTPGQVIVGFALETENELPHAIEKLERSGADMIVLNMPVARDSGFGKDSVKFSCLKKGEAFEAPALKSKSELAASVVNFVKSKLGV